MSAPLSSRLSESKIYNKSVSWQRSSDVYVQYDISLVFLIICIKLIVHLKLQAKAEKSTV